MGNSGTEPDDWFRRLFGGAVIFHFCLEEEAVVRTGLETCLNSLNK